MKNMFIKKKYLKEISSIGRATVLHTEGWVFESPISYCLIKRLSFNGRIAVFQTERVGSNPASRKNLSYIHLIYIY